jgi:SAM-dependent methyltransferase
LTESRPRGEPELVATRCPICVTNAFDREVYAANFHTADLNPEVFSARRVPDRLHYRMVRCGQCGLLRADPILDTAALAQLYQRSRFTYEAEAAFTCRTYETYLQRALPAVRARRRLLEIGCGSGFFLAAARRHGFAEVWGVEPSVDALDKAPPDLRPHIRVGLYEAATFPADFFDVVCAFQVLDHVPDPAAVVCAARTQLAPGGVALFINHDAGAWSARLLGAASPIVDVEHTVLFDRATMRRLFAQCGFQVRDVFGVRNVYPLDYWSRLAPLPAPVKRVLRGFLHATRLGTLPVALRAGNLGVVAVKDGVCAPADPVV